MTQPEGTSAGTPAKCAVHLTTDATGACALCKKPTCAECTRIVAPPGGAEAPAQPIAVCFACHAQVQAELAAERPDVSTLPRAVVGGLVAALVSGAVWALIAIVGNLAIGWIAVGVGYLAGVGVVVASGGKRGAHLQIVAVACALIGLVLGKYFIFAHAIKTALAEQGGPNIPDLGYFSSEIFSLFPQFLPKMVNGFDALWILFAVGAAWRVPAATKVSLD